MENTRDHWIDHMDMPIPLTGVTLHGDLVVPPDPKGIVLFSHGSDSSRKSPPDQWVADELHARGFAPTRTIHIIGHAQ